MLRHAALFTLTVIAIATLIVINAFNALDQLPFSKVFTEKLDERTFYVGSASLVSVTAKKPRDCEIRLPGIYDFSGGKALLGFYSSCEEIRITTEQATAKPDGKNCLSRQPDRGWIFMTPKDAASANMVFTNQPADAAYGEKPVSSDLPFRECVHSFYLKPQAKRLSLSESVWDIETIGLDALAYRGNAAATATNVVERSFWTDPDNRRHTQTSVYYTDRMMFNFQQIANILLSVIAGAGLAVFVDKVVRPSNKK